MAKSRIADTNGAGVAAVDVVDSSPLQSELDATKAELAATKLKLRQAKEERCLDELQRVLDKHSAKLTSLPGGNFQVVIE